MKQILAISMLLLCATSHADVLEDKTRELFEIQGVTKNFQAMIDQGRKQSRVETQKTIDQMLSQMSPSKEFQGRIGLAAGRYIENLQANRTAEEIVNLLIKNYAPNFTEQELDELIKFYGSSVGRKDAVVSKTATEGVVEFYRTDNERIRSEATNQFVRDLQLIVQECKCARQTKSSKN
jgi:hypothetical protein